MRRWAAEVCNHSIATPSGRAFANRPTKIAAVDHALQNGRVKGPMVHDARVAALCIAHGVTEFWTADRDFSRFPGLVARNPLHDS